MVTDVPVHAFDFRKELLWILWTDVRWSFTQHMQGHLPGANGHDRRVHRLSPMHLRHQERRRQRFRLQRHVDRLTLRVLPEGEAGVRETRLDVLCREVKGQPVWRSDQRHQDQLSQVGQEGEHLDQPNVRFQECDKRILAHPSTSSWGVEAQEVQVHDLQARARVQGGKTPERMFISFR